MTNEQKDAISEMLNDAEINKKIALKIDDKASAFYNHVVIDVLRKIFIFSKDNKVVDFNDKKLSKILKALK